MIKSSAEFSGERSRSYKTALAKFPHVWAEDMLVMKEYLRPVAVEQLQPIIDRQPKNITVLPYQADAIELPP